MRGDELQVHSSAAWSIRHQQRAQSLVEWAEQSGGGLFDEAYEFFADQPDSALRYVRDIDSRFFWGVSCFAHSFTALGQQHSGVVGRHQEPSGHVACSATGLWLLTDGSAAPGVRVGWVVGSKANITLFRNFSSMAMGGISKISQVRLLLVCRVLDGVLPKTEDRDGDAGHSSCGAGAHSHCQVLLRTAQQVQGASGACVARLTWRPADTLQRFARWGSSSSLAREVVWTLLLMCCTQRHQGFYIWCRLPNGLTSSAFNERLFRHKAAVLPGHLCDMHRTQSLAHFVRFSFGPLPASTFDEDIGIVKACL